MMIEKLKETYTETTRSKITQKINEIVDAINFIMEEFPEQTHALSMAIKHNTEEIEKHNPYQHEPFDYIGVRPSMAQVSNADPAKTTYNVATGKMEEPENIYTKTCRMDKEFAEEELERTKKKLDIAVDALREIHLPKQWCPVFAEQEIAKKALDEITALEQKE